MISKIPYYFLSLIMLLKAQKSPLSCLTALFYIPTRINLKNGVSVIVNCPLDLLILKEVVLDDEYQLLNLKEPKVIVDIGAGVGEFSIHAALRFPKAKVIAFEADPDRYRMLQTNIEYLGLNSIEIHRKEVGLQNQISDHISEEIDLLKIDCEGAEAIILNSLNGEIFRKIRRISMEYHNYLVPDVDLQIKEILSRNGFEFQQIPNYYKSTLGHIFAWRKS